MSETTLRNTLSSIGPDSTAPAAPTESHVVVARQTHKLRHDPVDYCDALEDAERLLKFAAETGVAVDATARDSILEARLTERDKWTERTVASLLVALTTLAAQLKPVSAESLRNFNSKTIVRRYWIVAIVLAAVIIPYSVGSFVSSSISQTVQSNITAANLLVVKLNGELVTSPANPASAPGAASAHAPQLAPGVSAADVTTDLQSLAATNRAIYAQTRQLQRLIFGAGTPYDEMKKSRGSLELPVPLPPEDLGDVTSKKIVDYQNVRFLANTVVGDVSVFYGAIAACILPVLYALLGTCAYLLRCFSQQMKSRTFVPSHSDSARFLIAAIGGAVVGFFGHLAFGQDASISPFAIAFLVGYAVDIFFSALDGLIQTFTKGKLDNVPDPKAA